MIIRVLVVALFAGSFPLWGGNPGLEKGSLRFEPASGAAAVSTAFRARGSAYDLQVESTGFRLGLGKSIPAGRAARDGYTLPPPVAHSAIAVRFVGAGSPSEGEGRQPLLSHSNYLVGGNREGWRKKVPHFGRVHFTEVYSGIDIAYYSSNGLLEFDFLVAAGADPRQIRMRVDGAAALRINAACDLVIATPDGEITQRRPQVFQAVANERVPIEGRYVLSGDGEVRFALDPYDEDLPLLIDPVLDWATFLGGAADDNIQDLTTDQQGNVYVIGRTVSANLPTEGPLQGALNGPTDLFISKLTPDGSGLVFSTYLGGSDLELPGGIAVDSEGNVYISGGTTSADFPTTDGSIQPSFGGGVDAFVAKLNPQGSDLIYSTFLGGTGQEIGYGLRRDSLNHVYVAGSVGTASVGFPVTEGAFQTTLAGQFDAFVTKIDPAGAALVYSTLFGGNGSEIPADIELNAQGEAHIAGIASSTNLPGTPGAYQEAVVAGTFDAFVAKFNATGSELEYLSFLGGSGDDEASGLSLDSMGNAWLSGGTGSSDFPTTPDAPNPNYLGGDGDGFLARLPLPQDTLLTSENVELSKGQAPTPAPLVTYVGSELRNFGLDILVREAPTAGQKGNVVLPFVHYSLSNFADTPTVVDGQTVTGPYGVTWTLDYNGNAVGDPFTTIGGEFRKITLDPDGNVLGGGSALPNAPSTEGSVDPEHNGSLDGFVAKATESSTTFPSTLTIEKRLLYPRDGVVRPFQQLRYEVIVTLVEGLSAQVTLFDTLEGMDLEAIYPSPRLSDRETRRYFEFDLQSPTTGFPVRGVACRTKPPENGRTVIECRRHLFTGESIRLLVHATAPNRPGDVIRNTAVADAPGANEVTAMLEHVVDDPFGGINEVICQAVCDDGTALGLNAAKGVEENGPVCATPVRKRSLAELVRTIKLACTGLDELDDLVELSVQYNSQVEITSKIIEVQTGFSEAVGLTGDFLSGDHRVLAPGDTPTGNENVFPGLIGTRPDGGGSIFWPQVLAYRNPQGLYEINLANIRIDTTRAVTDTVTGEIIVAAEAPAAGLAPATSTTKITIKLDESLPTVRSYQDYLQLVPGIEVRFAETASDQFRKRFTSHDNLFYFEGINLSESGFVPNGTGMDDPAGIGVAQSGTRLAIALENVPAGVKPYVNTCIDSESFFGEEALARLVARFIEQVRNTDYSSGLITEVCEEQREAPVANGRIDIAYEVTGPAGVTGAEGLDAFRIPIQFDCPPGTQGEGRINSFLAPIERVEVLGDPHVPVFGRPPVAGNLFRWENACEGTAFEAEQIKQPGVTNAATFQDPPAPGGLASLGYQNGQIIELRTATSVPLPTRLKKTEFIIDLSDQPNKLRKALIDGAEAQGFYRAPLLFTSPTQINAQLPWEIDPALSTVQGYILAGGVLSEPFDIPVSMFSPGIFTFDFGPGRAIVTNLDNSVAQPEGSLAEFPALTARPARVGDFIVILATGLGPVNPPAVTGDNSLDENGNFIQRDVVEPVRVFIGGVEATVTFAGLSPEFVGVYQLNVQITEGTPVGDEVSIVIEVGGVRSREDATIAVAP